MRRIITRNVLPNSPDTKAETFKKAAILASNFSAKNSSLSAAKKFRYSRLEICIRHLKNGLTKEKINTIFNNARFSSFTNFIKSLPPNALSLQQGSSSNRHLSLPEFVSFPNISNYTRLFLNSKYTINDFINRFDTYTDMPIIGGAVAGQSFTRLMRSPCLIGIIFRDIDTGLKSQPIFSEGAYAFELDDKNIAFITRWDSQIANLRRACPAYARVISFKGA